ncbi:MAG: EAL domain-containing protein [Acidiferrobacter sp.]
MSDEAGAYGPEAAVLLDRARDYFAAADGRFAAAFYAGLARHAGHDDVMARLDPAWSVCVHNEQQAQLRCLFDPDLDASAHRTKASGVGAIHAFIGIQTPALVDGYALYLERLLEHLQAWSGDPQEREQLRQILIMRLMADLNGQIQGQHRIAHAQQQAIAALAHIPETVTTFNDLARRLLEVLTDLDGVVAGTLTRPDGNGDLQFEIVVGQTARAHGPAMLGRQIIPSIHAETVRGQGPSGRAWRSGQVQAVPCIPAEPTLAPWHAFAQDLGYVALATIPIVDAAGRPQALLSVYHSWPGYFASPDRANLLNYLFVMLGTAWSRFTVVGPVVPHAVRAVYRQRLTERAVTMLYQPVIDLRSGHVRRVEALARLQGVDGALVSPGDFLPAFGEHELRQLFAVGVRQAFADLRFWEGQGLVTAVAVNMPMQALTDPEYLAITRAALHDLRIDPARLTLELLETGEAEHAHGGGVPAAWRALGVRLAQDDLGSGYSSLLRMEKIAVDDVKIDQGLVSTAAKAPRKALQFIHHLTRLVHDLGVIVVVEGLESPGLIEAATILGADAGQGYAISYPMPARQLSSWVAHFTLTVSAADPKTALGAYAAMIRQNHMLALADPWPALFQSIATEPCGLAHYVQTAGLDRQPLGEAYQRLLALARQETQSARYHHVYAEVEALLCTQILVEEGRDGVYAPQSAFRSRRRLRPRSVR